MQTDQFAPQATRTGGSESILVWEGREIFVDKRMVGGRMTLSISISRDVLNRERDQQDHREMPGLEH